MITKFELLEFEQKIANEWDAGNIWYPVHLSGGNEDELIEIFKKVKTEDWVFSSHRNHYHYLLKGGDQNKLYEMIMRGDSMHIMDKKLNFFSTGIVAGQCAIAVGVAKAIVEKQEHRNVWCFVGDGATDEGHFWEALNYSEANNLPITFIVEDNNRSVCSSKSQRGCMIFYMGTKGYAYEYKPIYPHVGTGKTIKFKDMGEVKNTL